MKIIIPLILPLFFLGCANMMYVDQQFEKVNQRVDDMQKRLAEQQEAIDELQSITIKEAEQRVRKKGGKGIFLYSVVLEDDSVKFGPKSATISDDNQKKLMVFAQKLKQLEGDLYIEIIGHTDEIGDVQVNHWLGLQRAENVRDFLYETYEIPLHRMDIYSYGELIPIASDATEEGRAKNRRVQILVLR